MFCKQCGKEIHDQAVVCVHCGCAVDGAQIPQRNQHAQDLIQSPDRAKLSEIEKDAKSIFLFGILSLALSMGIGLIFQIINFSKINSKYYSKAAKGWGFPELNLSATEAALYETLKQKIKNGRLLTVIGLIITAVLLWILFMVVVIGITYGL